jgi:hypothetical protein
LSVVISKDGYLAFVAQGGIKIFDVRYPSKLILLSNFATPGIKKF